MLSLTRQLHLPLSWLHCSATSQLHHPRLIRTDSAPTRQRRLTKLPGTTTAMLRKKTEEKSEWWIVDGEMHEIGDNVPVRERFVIPRDNLPNRRRKQMREQFMRRTRLVLKESEHEPFCKKYMELYNELRENWERLYWDKGYSKKLASDHANYDSAEDDDRDFSPYRKSQSYNDLMKEQTPGRSRQFETLDKVSQIRDKFEYDREKRMREKAFAPMRPGFVADDGRPSSKIQPFDMNRYFSSEDEDE